MTILLSVWCCLVVRFWKILHPSSETSLKATAKWWFSNTDSSLYIKASSEPGGGTSKRGQRSVTMPRGGISERDAPVVTKNWLVRPGWSTSCMALAKMAASTSKSVNTVWKQENNSVKWRMFRTLSALKISTMNLTRSGGSWVFTEVGM